MLTIIAPARMVVYGWEKWIFGASLLALLASLGLSLREIQVSIDALTIEVADLDDGDRPQVGMSR